jgi:hypothetical protein
MNKNLLVLTLVAACGDNHGIKPDAAPADAAPDASMLVPQAVMVGADFMSGTGIVSKLDVTSLTMTTNVVPGAATSDPVIRYLGGTIYIVNRSVGENVTILDAKTLALSGQFSTGTGSNPQDVAVVGNKLYIPALGTAGLVVMTLPAGTTTTIALDTAVGDPDGKPDCVSAFTVGTDVYVACDLLDSSYIPRGPGQVAVIDTTTDTVRTTFALPFKNPQGFFHAIPHGNSSDLLISTVPAFDDYTDGCVVRITPGTTPTAACADSMTNHALAGFVNGIAVGSSFMWLSVLTDQSFMTTSGQLRVFQLNGEGLEDPESGRTEQIGDVAACSDGSVVGIDSKSTANGARVWKNLQERTTTPLSLGLPPVFSGGVVCYDAP